MNTNSADRRTARLVKTELFALVYVAILLLMRKTFQEAQNAPEKIPSRLKPLIAMPDFPKKLVAMLDRSVA